MSTANRTATLTTAELKAPSAGRSVSVGSRRRRHQPGQHPLTGKIIGTAFFLVVAGYMILPLLWLVLSVTKSPGQLFSDSGFVFGSFADLAHNLGRLFQVEHGVFLLWIRNTILYAVVGAIGATLLSVMAGYAFDKLNFPFKEKLFAFVLVGILVPSTVVSLPMYLLASKIGMVNTFWAVLIPSLVSPFGVYLARVFSEGYIDRSLIEAARVDGAGELTILRKIALPLLAPGSVTIFLLTFSGIWNSFFLSLVMLSDQNLFSIGLGLYNWNLMSRTSPEYYSLVLAGALVSVLPLIAIFVALQRYWRAGMTAGAVK